MLCSVLRPWTYGRARPAVAPEAGRAWAESGRGRTGYLGRYVRSLGGRSRQSAPSRTNASAAAWQAIALFIGTVTALGERMGGPDAESARSGDAVSRPRGRRRCPAAATNSVSRPSHLHLDRLMIQVPCSSPETARSKCQYGVADRSSQIFVQKLLDEV